MDNGHRGQNKPRRTMGCLGAITTILGLCVTILKLHSTSDAAAISPRLPPRVVMAAIVEDNKEPLSVSWEYNGQALVEYKNNHVASYDPRVSLPQEQFKDGNFSLILTNITISDSGNYTCLIQHGDRQQIYLYALQVEKQRIMLFDLSPKRTEGNTDENALGLQSVPSSLPTHIVMTSIIVVKQKPLNLDYVSLTWEHNRSPLVEYKDNHVISYDPRASLPQEQFKDGNFSLILKNITINDVGIYTCLIQYGNEKQTAQYALEVEKNRIQLFDLSPKKVVENMDEIARKKMPLNRSSKKSARESGQPTSGLFLQIVGIPRIIAKPGANVSLMCKFNTESSVELSMFNISWSKNGVTKWILTTDSEEEAKLEELSKGNANLNLTSVQMSDSGNYSCNIIYRTLKKSYITRLIVTDAVFPCSHPLCTTVDPPLPRYRKEKIGMVVGAIAFVNCLAIFIIFFVAV